jgi:hypothetical protein
MEVNEDDGLSAAGWFKEWKGAWFKSLKMMMMMDTRILQSPMR